MIPLCLMMAVPNTLPLLGMTPLSLVGLRNSLWLPQFSTHLLNLGRSRVPGGLGCLELMKKILWLL